MSLHLKQGRERIRWARRQNCTAGGTDVTGALSRYFTNCEPTPCSSLTFAVFFRLFSSFQFETLPYQDYALWSPGSRPQMPTLLPSKAELQLDCVLAYLLPFPTLFPLIPLFWKHPFLHYIHLSLCLMFCLYGVQHKKSYNSCLSYFTKQYSCERSELIKRKQLLCFTQFFHPCHSLTSK